MTLKYTASGLERFEELLAAIPDATRTAASRAINAGARFALAESKREIVKQTNFNKRYLDDKLTVTKFASESDLEAVVRGEFQPRSLAGFATNRPNSFAKRYKVAPRIKVAAGGSFGGSDRLFFLALRSGTKFDADNFNVGVAVRLRKGETIKGTTAAFKPTKLKNVYLLYGPSVNQVFRDVAPSIAPDVAAKTANEFSRQLRLLTGGKYGL